MVRDRGLTMHGEADGALHMVGALSDVTECRQAEDVLSRYRLLAAEVQEVMLFVRGRDGRLLEVKSAAETAYGYSRRELLELDVYALRASVGGPSAAELLEAAKAGGMRYETKHRRKDGSVFPVEASIRGVTLIDGEEVYLGIARDISERKRAEEELRESEDKFKYVFDHSVIGKSLTLPTGELRVNDAVCRMLGYSRKELEGKKMHEITHPDDVEASQRSLEAMLSGSQDKVHVVKRYVHKNGSVVWADVSTSLRRDETGEPLYFITSVVDITKRKQDEAEIRRLNAELEERVVSRTAQLEATNKELEAFAYSVSHDVRAPLRAIDGFSAMVLEDDADNLSEESVGHLRRARGAAQRMARLLDDLLGLSRISRQDLLRARVDLSALARELAAELSAEHPSRRVDVSIAAEMSADADPALVRIIFRELLANAWKFTSRHESAHIEVGVWDADVECAFFVRDDGAGFDMDRAKQLFGAFQRMHRADEFEGEGIGLATVQRLVTRHGGRVWAEAEVEKGATFYFTLPAEWPISI
jgi:PAS domain S-box-containing protein